jgi:hypothetical protein
MYPRDITSGKEGERWTSGFVQSQMEGWVHGTRWSMQSVDGTLNVWPASSL